MKGSPYETILSQATSTPKTVTLPSEYDAGIAATCLRSLARKRHISDFNAKKLKNTVLVWRGKLEEIPFTMPSRKKFVISAEAYERAQVLGAFSMARGGPA